MKPFFIEIQNFWAWADKLADKFWGIWSIFGQNISTHFGKVSSLSIIFRYSTIIPTKKTKLLYPHTKYLFGIVI